MSYNPSQQVPQQVQSATNNNGSSWPQNLNRHSPPYPQKPTPMAAVHSQISMAAPTNLYPHSGIPQSNSAKRIFTPAAQRSDQNSYFVETPPQSGYAEPQVAGQMARSQWQYGWEALPPGVRQRLQDDLNEEQYLQNGSQSTVQTGSSSPSDRPNNLKESSATLMPADGYSYDPQTAAGLSPSESISYSDYLNSANKIMSSAQTLTSSSHSSTKTLQPPMSQRAPPSNSTPMISPGIPGTGTGAGIGHAPPVITSRKPVGGNSYVKTHPMHHSNDSRKSYDRRSSLSVIEKFEKTRREAFQQPHNPQVQLQWVEQLFNAARVLASRYQDPTTASTTQVAPAVQERNCIAWVSEAMEILNSLALKRSYLPAIFMLASSYSSGVNGLEKDHHKAFELYIRAAKQDYPEACYRAAVCYEIGMGVHPDPSRAIAWFKRAAQLGDVAAMYKLGMIMLLGTLNQPQSVADGLQWLLRASENADSRTPHALHELGNLHENPLRLLNVGQSKLTERELYELVPRDENLAFDYYNRSALLGHTRSEYRLGRAYEFGELGCQIDAAKSIHWYTLGSNKGDAQCELSLAGWYWTGAEGILRASETEAFLWAEKSANRHFGRAEFALGHFYEVGVGVSPNQEKAIYWFSRALEHQHPKAASRLQLLAHGG